MIIFVLLAGLGGYFLSDNYQYGVPDTPNHGEEVQLEWKSQFLGWTSAVLYLGSRVPQIAHNLWVSSGCVVVD